jgi:hypothetical protein
MESTRFADKLCMHISGCEQIATRFEGSLSHWHDWIWCNEHAVDRETIELTAVEEADCSKSRDDGERPNERSPSKV